MSSSSIISKPEIHAVLENATLRYAQVWEDYELLFQGLELQSSDHVVSIGSAGDNALALLAKGVESVAAVDLNPAQTALCELKKVAIERLEHADFAELLGIGEGKRALSLLGSLRNELSPLSRAYWDSNTEIVEQGILHSGRLEVFWNKMREQVFEQFITPTAMREFFHSQDLDEQRQRFERDFSGASFCEAFRNFTDKKNVARHGRDIAQYKYVSRDDIGGFFWNRFKHVCTEVPVSDNFYLHYLFFGNYASFEEGPFYLRPKVFADLVHRIERFEIVEESLDAFVAKGERTYSKMNLSDLFEYLSPEDTDHFLSILVENMAIGGRIAFWNHLNERSTGSTSGLKTKELHTLGSHLFQRDRTFFYSDFRVLEVL